jgi:ectoine hydroxylase-related dioxygenase (phytanoyl-CoA dioxygenase family)
MTNMNGKIKLDEDPDKLLSASQILSFQENGFLILKDFYNTEEEIIPLVEKIYSIFKVIIDKHDLNIDFPAFSESAFDDVYYNILSCDRRLCAVIYDVVKQLPEFARITTLSQNQKLTEELCNSNNVGIAGGGSGIRINNPNEDKFLAGWHQEYPAQLRSLDGIVFWSPIVKLTPEIGPVVLCPKSHKKGIYPMEISNDKNVPEAYRLKISNTEEVLSPFEELAPCISPGDLIVMNFLLLHRSGINVSKRRALWSLQFRYFNFEDPEGQKIDWKGSYVNGNKFEDIYPHLIVTNQKREIHDE